MTETVYTHKPAVMRKPGWWAFADQLGASAPELCAVDTHEFQIRCMLGCVQLPQLLNGVHAYPQSALIQLSLSMAQSCTAIASHPSAQRRTAQRSAGVYTYKQPGAGRLGVIPVAGTSDLVYTYKQIPAARAPWSASGHRRPPPAVYTYKQPQSNPAQSGVRCVWGLKTGEPP